MNAKATVNIDGRDVPIEGERNLLELVRKAGVELPTFCYHSDLSIYGACRLCLVQVDGRGIHGACSTPPEPGMKVRTTTEEIREIRRMTLELLLASHDNDCPTCPKSSDCQLQNLARRLGVEKVRFKPMPRNAPVDRSSQALVRDPNKCVLCGDCVRMCAEVQGIGAIDFAHRGSSVAVLPAFGKDLAQVECVNCGQCAAVCPTGALYPRSEVEAVWKDLDDPKKLVVAQIAPAVRVALGEFFGMEPGTVTTGRIVAALKAMGFDRVFDTAFAADLTVIEEASEFLGRATRGERLPQFTSCCPAWVQFAEQYHPELLPNLSTCRSPQQMFGSMAKEILPRELGLERRDLVVVSIMPCTAKKAEARLPRYEQDGVPDVDHVLTTRELARMIEEAGLHFQKLAPASLDLPLGFKTGAGVIFGSSGGVTEAVLRYAAEKLAGTRLEAVDFEAVRGEDGLREAVVEAGGRKLRLAVVHGLARARQLAEKAAAGRCEYDLVEVMACPGGCVGGAGQPVCRDLETRRARARGLYETDKTLQLHKSQDNPAVAECYQKHLGEVGGEKAHHLLHTGYQTRRRIQGRSIDLVAGAAERLQVGVCVGTGCHVRGAQDLLRGIIRHVEASGLEDRVEVRASFCFESCDRGPTVVVGDTVLRRTTLGTACEAIQCALDGRPLPRTEHEERSADPRPGRLHEQGQVP